MKPTKQVLVAYLSQFIVRVAEGRVSIDEFGPDHTLEELRLESLDFIELNMLLLDEYQMDLFKELRPDYKTLTIDALAEHLIAVN